MSLYRPKLTVHISLLAVTPNEERGEREEERGEREKEREREERERGGGEGEIGINRERENIRLSLCTRKLHRQYEL